MEVPPQGLGAIRLRTFVKKSEGGLDNPIHKKGFGGGGRGGGGGGSRSGVIHGLGLRSANMQSIDVSEGDGKEGGEDDDEEDEVGSDEDDRAKPVAGFPQFTYDPSSKFDSAAAAATSGAASAKEAASALRATRAASAE
jgi:hypothetical protein